MLNTFNRKELLLITVAWVLVYASTPLYMYYALLSIQEAFQWQEVFSSWGYQTAFLVLFLLDHFVLIPLFINRKRFVPYLGCLAVCIVLFVWFLTAFAPEPKFVHHPTVHPFLLPPPDLARLMIALLMVGADLGGVAWFKEQQMRKRLLLLEQQALQQELDHLRYQINPHFFMNTLNNIHVLVDLDQERAKRAIVELSGLMRYALYEGNHSLSPLSKELEFIRLYISLMKLRYNEKVSIEINLPETVTPSIQLPPLLLATFIENAFKHGVSYQEPSFIRVSLSVDDKMQQIHFQCVNSCHLRAASTDDGHHGIGLINVRKRLSLLYADRCDLHIDDTDTQQFSVELTLPTTIEQR